MLFNIGFNMLITLDVIQHKTMPSLQVNLLFASERICWSKILCSLCLSASHDTPLWRNKSLTLCVCRHARTCARVCVGGGGGEGGGTHAYLCVYVWVCVYTCASVWVFCEGVWVFCEGVLVCVSLCVWHVFVCVIACVCMCVKESRCALSFSSCGTPYCPGLPSSSSYRSLYCARIVSSVSIALMMVLD